MCLMARIHSYSSEIHGRSNEGRAQFESVIRSCFLLSKRWKVDFKWFFVGHS
jgi:hypothetical protein